MTNCDDWDERHRRQRLPEPPARVLQENRHLLPPAGEALDLACGLGGNALLLAEHGLRTQAWDSSAVAIDALRAEAAARGLPIRAELRDVLADPPEPDRFDVIVVSRFLERALADALTAALRPGGLLFYQTYTRSRVGERGPRNEQWRLADGELLALFAALRPLVYREEGRVGDLTLGFRDEALLVAIKPADRPAR